MSNETLNPLTKNYNVSTNSLEKGDYSSIYHHKGTPLSSIDIETEPHSDNNNPSHHEEVVPPTKMPPWLCDLLEPVFKMRKRKTTIEQELYCGVIQFISCLYVLPVVPFQMKRVGYIEASTIVATSATCSLGSMIAGFLTDMPFIIAPPTSVSIFLAVSMQQSGLRPLEGNAAVMISGAGLALVGALPPLSRLVTK
eukprot:gene22576-29233_t